jgi:hypothetical membrane protein
MSLNYRQVAGFLLFVAGVECVLGIIVAEALYTGYSTSLNYISDLGIGPSALVFNSAVFLLGVLSLSSVYFVWKEFRSRFFTVVLAVAAVGAMGVGIFTEHMLAFHAAFSLTLFAFAGISAVVSFRVAKSWFSYVSIALGIISLAALPLMVSGNDLGLGIGGMERLIAYPSLLWMIGFGGHLVGDSKNPLAAQE